MRHEKVSVMTAGHPNNSEPIPHADRVKKRLTNKALHYLGRYASTSARLEAILHKFAKLKLGQVDPAQLGHIIREVVESCVSRGYVDDDRIAKCVCQHIILDYQR